MVRVIVAEDNKHIRTYICKLLEKTGLASVVADVKDGYETIRSVEECKADLLLLDIEMPGMSGIEVLEYLRRRRISIDVLILSGYSDRELIRGALELGAKGYILKDEALYSLKPAIQSVREKHQVFLSDMARQVLSANAI